MLLICVNAKTLEWSQDALIYTDACSIRLLQTRYNNESMWQVKGLILFSFTGWQIAVFFVVVFFLGGGHGLTLGMLVSSVSQHSSIGIIYMWHTHETTVLNLMEFELQHLRVQEGSVSASGL